jgi:hypothetical protein
MRILEIDRHHAQIIARELDQVMILEQPRIRREERALLGLVEMRLERGGAALLEGAEHAEHQRQQVLIVLRLPLAALERAHHALAGLLHRRHRIGHDEGADRRAADRHQLVRQGMQR